VSLTVLSFAEFLTDTFQKWRNDDFHANKFTKAVKGESFKGYALVPVRGTRLRLATANRADAVVWFGQMAADYLVNEVRLNPKASFGLVPIPSTDAVEGLSFQRFPPRDLANALAKELAKQGIRKIKVFDVLRWTEKMESARKGGPREPSILYPRLKLVGKVIGVNHCILVDDVCTSGGHLQTAAARLRKDGANVPLAVCAARTRQFAVDDPFAASSEELEDYMP